MKRNTYILIWEDWKKRIVLLNNYIFCFQFKTRETELNVFEYFIIQINVYSYVVRSKRKPNYYWFTNNKILKYFLGPLDVFCFPLSFPLRFSVSHLKSFLIFSEFVFPTQFSLLRCLLAFTNFNYTTQTMKISSINIFTTFTSVSLDSKSIQNVTSVYYLYE